MTIVIMGMVLTALLITAAIVVDIGAVYAARRSDQSGADHGALGAAQDLNDEAEAVSRAKSVVHDNLGRTLTAAEWNSCGTDAGSLEVRAAGANCISFNGARSRVRVRIPDQYVATGFASIVGIDRIRHTAFAIAGVNQRGFGGVLPFGMPAAAGSGDGYACVKSNPGGLSSGPCAGPSAGNFGTIDLSLYGNEDVGTTKSCGPGDTSDRIANNVAVGTDHRLEVYVTGSVKVDTAYCEDLLPGPNAARTETGTNHSAVGRGLFSGREFTDGGPARLQRISPELFDGGGRVREVHDVLVDDNPLWAFIPPSLQSGVGPGGDVPRSCLRDQFEEDPELPGRVEQHLRSMTDANRLLALMQRCMTHYRGDAWGGGGQAGEQALTPPEPRVGCRSAGMPCTDPVFSSNVSSEDAPNLYDIQYTPRFGYVPVIDEFPTGQSTAVPFLSFQAIYLQRLTIGNGRNATIFNPGFAPEGDGNGGDVGEVTAWVFPFGMLPGRLQEPNAPYAIGVNRFVQLVR
ncbi:hypothetical protein HC251_08835 [Iamia sp. SCSIO 61187]|uniref:hypothetical protein n=1 Tax=Iamia sp. SCSIO 61187 TaxID=2722752 RepID=UPI001C62A5AD|nr:hypothetical protein [Iamia sp. SCSIO 61187]QYG92538.1 hypothetical protein HC251_08835 [Iamia sp. SCSIO 61187]